MANPKDDTDELPIQPGLDAVAARYFGPPTPETQVEFGALSHPGKVRASNEDHYCVIRRRRSRELLLNNLPDDFLPQAHDDAYTMAVADGMGGVAFGELASMLAVRAGWDLTSQAFKWHFKITERETEDIKNVLQVYGQLINRTILQKGREQAGAAGMGTTLTAAILIGTDAYIGHIGDSRAYLYRAGSLRQLTRDHTLAQRLVDKGVIPNIEAADEFMRHALVNCLGGNRNDVEVETHHVPLRDGDCLLVCSDGLTDMVDDEAIARVLSAAPKCDDACRLLVDQASTTAAATTSPSCWLVSPSRVRRQRQSTEWLSKCATASMRW